MLSLSKHDNRTSLSFDGAQDESFPLPLMLSLSKQDNRADLSFDGVVKPSCADLIRASTWMAGTMSGHDGEIENVPTSPSTGLRTRSKIDPQALRQHWDKGIRGGLQHKEPPR
ncbi:MAG: hypothetical protein A2516_01055 [Alphaproteobacteria bacterium RIFOXYD12_FULL_60_8]|nr:MAG: hypothetical protein A2516_01055 [Alphaproteobacteria bacterium RIFOXYD12_FULL_60_8]